MTLSGSNTNDLNLTDLVHTYIHMYNPLREVHIRIVLSAPRTRALLCGPQQKHPNVTPRRELHVCVYYVPIT